MKKIVIFVCCLILGPIVGCLSSIFWHEGANTFWSKIDYFPYPVKTIIAAREHASEFWVETTENDLYRITYPCLENQTCWITQEQIPDDLTNYPGLEYRVDNNKCGNDSIVYPLLHKIQMCITTLDHTADATWISSIALTEDQTLWVWDQPWQDPFSVMMSMFLATIVSTVIGVFAGMFFLLYGAIKRKGK